MTASALQVSTTVLRKSRKNRPTRLITGEQSFNFPKKSTIFFLSLFLLPPSLLLLLLRVKKIFTTIDVFVVLTADTSMATKHRNQSPSKVGPFLVLLFLFRSLTFNPLSLSICNYFTKLLKKSFLFSVPRLLPSSEISHKAIFCHSKKRKLL